ncbi:hypothetical protein [Pseudomonas mosselii]|uniref:hypothetical protein n=1 Tax=Pseudomonas mosselii TaxID=78327 RepID=UPI003D2DAFA1
MDSFDIIDGKRVPGTKITSDEVLLGSHHGSISVIGCTFVIAGSHHGSLSVSGNGRVIVEGQHHGSTSLSEGSRLEVVGSSHGSTSIAAGSILVVEPFGKLAGSMHNNGRLVIRGAFGGAYSGRGESVVEGDGYIKQPRIEGGVHYYEW